MSSPPLRGAGMLEAAGRGDCATGRAASANEEAAGSGGGGRSGAAETGGATEEGATKDGSSAQGFRTESETMTATHAPTPTPARMAPRRSEGEITPGASASESAKGRHDSGGISRASDVKADAGALLEGGRTSWKGSPLSALWRSTRTPFIVW